MSDSSLFGDLDVASAADDPFAIPDNTYHAFVFKVETGRTKPKKDGSTKMGMTLFYKIAGGDYDGRQIREWKEIPQPEDKNNLTDKEKQAAAYLKARLISLGIPSDKMNDVAPDDLVGIEVNVSVITNDAGFVQVRKVEIDDGGSEVSFT